MSHRYAARSMRFRSIAFCFLIWSYLLPTARTVFRTATAIHSTRTQRHYSTTRSMRRSASRGTNRSTSKCMLPRMNRLGRLTRSLRASPTPAWCWGACESLKYPCRWLSSSCCRLPPTLQRLFLLQVIRFGRWGCCYWHIVHLCDRGHPGIH
ncbi:MAG: hypothetical protein J3Q66DRAFT_322583 [Benniella sp.]|nr:MAG: hypothetical protein J3Q66DRAFT_322583 [Benniella sp.]